MIGFVFVFTLFTASVLYTVIADDYMPVKILAYDENGYLISGALLKPSEAPPLGTDFRGYNIGVMILIGAKYTIGVAVIITVIRMAVSALFGWLYGMYLYRFRRWRMGIFDSMHFIPMTLLAFLILLPVLMMEGDTRQFASSRAEREWFEIMFLAIIAVPIVSIQIGNIIGEIRQREFIDSSRVLGANRVQIFWKDIRSHLLPRFSLLFIQQMIQIMILLIHLGIMQLFFGGTLFVGEGETYSLSNEWSGLVGQYFDGLMWRNNLLLLGPLTTFTLTILGFNFIMEGMKKVIAGEDMVPAKKKRAPAISKQKVITGESFEPIQR